MQGDFTPAKLVPCTTFDDADGLDDYSGNTDDVVTSTTCLKVKHTVH